jgi:ABC-type bacteriocin/lantibiotic exporter with double-glycine peptidase domain
MLNNLFSILSKRQKYFFFFTNFLIFFGALLEMLGISLIIPAATLILDSTKKDLILNYFQYFEKINTENLLMYFLIFMTFFFLFKFFFSIFLIYLQGNLIRSLQLNISAKVFQSFSNLSFVSFLEKKSSELIKNMNIEIQYFAIAIRSVFLIITESLVILTIGMLLLIYNFQITVLVLAIFTIIFLCLKYFTGNKLNIISKEREVIENKIIKNLQNFFSLQKEIKIYEKNNFFFQKHFESLKSFSKIFKSQYIIVQFPRYILELITFFIFVYLIIYYNFFLNEKENLIPTLALYGISTFRLLPSINRLINGVNDFKFYGPSINILKNEIDPNLNSKKIAEKYNDTNDQLNFNNYFILDRVSFSYKNNNKVLEKFSFKFLKGEKVGILGESGSGKTTLINIITGLLTPTEGKILVDDILLSKQNINDWQNNIGYVPQNVVLMDDTIRNNIAFGIKENQIDDQILKSTLFKANLSFFVNSLDQGVNTMVGELGNSLSGGQLQRIGIARALYKKSKILILDEATSSLDEKTEMKIIEEIFSFGDEITIITVTHRKENLKFCDKIINLNDYL